MYLSPVVSSVPKAMGNLRQIILGAAMDAWRLLQVHKVVNEKGFHIRIALQIRQHLERLRFQTAMRIPNSGAPEGGVL